MNLFNIIATAAPKAAEAAVPAQQQQGSLWTLAPFFIIIVAMFFLSVRANKKQKARQQEMLNKLVKGTKVILNSGIIGTIAEVKEDHIKVEIAANCVIQILPASVMQILDETQKESDK